jgi:hypothetical protein
MRKDLKKPERLPFGGFRLEMDGVKQGQALLVEIDETSPYDRDSCTTPSWHQRSLLKE